MSNISTLANIRSALQVPQTYMLSQEFVQNITHETGVRKLTDYALKTLWSSLQGLSLKERNTIYSPLSKDIKSLFIKSIIQKFENVEQNLEALIPIMQESIKLGEGETQEEQESFFLEHILPHHLQQVLISRIKKPVSIDEYTRILNQYKDSPCLKAMLSIALTCEISTIIGLQSSVKIKDFLQKHPEVRNLKINSHRIQRDTQTLAEALKQNKTLIKLDLSHNSFRPDDAKAIAEALEVNQTLTSLDLSYNIINATGAQYLAKALEANTTLTNLNLLNNFIGLEEAEALRETFGTKTMLTNLVLEGQVLRGEEEARIRELQGCLTSLCDLTDPDNLLRTQRLIAGLNGLLAPTWI